MVHSDKRHRELVARKIKQIEGLYEPEDIKIEVEKHYNYYGSRGFIDILTTTINGTIISEVKPDLDNLGEGIRQLRRARDAILKGAIDDFPINKNKVIMQLVTELNEHNYNILKESYGIIRYIENFSINLYCLKTDDFNNLPNVAFSEKFEQEPIDPLDDKWMLCRHGLKINEVVEKFFKFYPSFGKMLFPKDAKYYTKKEK